MSIRLGTKWQDKPAFGAMPDPSHPQNAGTRLWYLFNENGGNPFDIVGRNLASSQPATDSGKPTWVSTANGIARSGFSTTAYDVIDPSTQILGVTYPFANILGVISPTSASDQCVFSAGSGSTNNPNINIEFNVSGVSGTLSYNFRDNATVHASASLTSVSACTDGLYHTIAGVSYSSSDHRLFVDGIQLAQDTTTIGAATMPLFTIGMLRRTTLINPFLGSILWYKVCVGSIPDMAWLATEPYAGIFAPPARRITSFGVPLTVRVTDGYPNGTGNPLTIGPSGSLPGGGSPTYTSFSSALSALTGNANIASPGHEYLIWNFQFSGTLSTAASYAIDLSSVTSVNASYYCWLTPYAGAGFRDNVNAVTNALVYNESNGAAIKQTNTYNNGVYLNAYCRIYGMQVKAVNGHGLGGSGNEIIESCIIDTTTGYTNVSLYGTMVDTTICDRSVSGSGTAAVQILSTSAIVENCTILRLSTATHPAFNGTTAGIVRGCAIFGFASASSGTAPTFSYCATDLATLAGTGNTTSVAFSTATFQSITADFRAVGGGALAGAGYHDTTTSPYNATVDIVGQTRANPPYAGAYEVVASGSLLPFIDKASFGTFQSMGF